MKAVASAASQPTHRPSIPIALLNIKDLLTFLCKHTLNWLAVCLSLHNIKQFSESFRLSVVQLRQALAFLQTHTDTAGFHQRFGSFITQYDTQFDLRVIRS